MELGSQIRRYRSERGMSQDDLAGRIFVSRQTISNWENDRTYPDVQNLLLLSDLFDVTIDQLTKGDLDTMKQALDKDVRSMKNPEYDPLWLGRGHLHRGWADAVWGCSCQAGVAVAAFAHGAPRPPGPVGNNHRP